MKTAGLIFAGVLAGLLLGILLMHHFTPSPLLMRYELITHKEKAVDGGGSITTDAVFDKVTGDIFTYTLVNTETLASHTMVDKHNPMTGNREEIVNNVTDPLIEK